MKHKLSRSIAMIAVGLATLSLCHGATLDPAAFTHRLPITFSGYSGSAPLTDFPVLVKFSTAIPGFNYAGFTAGGKNLRFADTSDQELSYEIDTWDTAGTSLIWVRVPSLTSTTTIRAYWGANYIEHAPSHSDGTTWSGGEYVGVWHLNEASAASDSSPNNLHGTLTGTASDAAGKIGNARQISNGAVKDKGGYGITIPDYNSLSVGNTFTFSTWLKYKAGQLPYNDRIVSRKTVYDENAGWEITLANYGADYPSPANIKTSKENLVHRGAGTESSRAVFSDVSNGNWYYLTVIYNGSSSSVYVDGVSKGSHTTFVAATDPSGGRTLVFGNNQPKGEVTFKGSLDEIRIRDSVSSADWIAAEYKTVTDAAFATYGNIEALQSPLPMLTPSDVASTAFHSADLIYTLTKLGTPNPDIKIAYGTTSENLTTTSTVTAAVSAAVGTFTNTLSGLLCNTTYYARHLAVNTSGTSLSPEFSFKTPDEPILSAATITATGYTLECNVSLTNIGVENPTVELWVGRTPESLAVVKTWTDLSSTQSLAETLTSQPSGAHYAKFRAYNVCAGVTNETWTAIVSDTIFGDCTWTGNASDSDFNNPANWSSGTVPGSSDIATFTSVGLTENEGIKLNANQTVLKLIIDTTTAFTIGDATDVTAGYSLTLTDFERKDVAGTEGRHTFGAAVNLKPDAEDNSTWTINGDDLVRMNRALGSTAETTFVKLGSGTFNMNFASPTYAGPWKITEGIVTASAVNSFRGNIEVGGTEVTAAFTQTKDDAIVGGSSITVLTNGTFTADASGAGLVSSLHVKEGGQATIGTFFFCYKGFLTGGTINGGRFYNGGYDQKLVTYGSPVTAVLNADFMMGAYFTYNSTIEVADGAAVVDLDMRKAIQTAGNTGIRLFRKGAGTAIFAQESTYVNSSSTNDYGWLLQAGRSIFMNETGSAVGKNPTKVDGGATIGGTGFVGGDSAHPNYWLNLQGASAGSLAVLEPGAIDSVTGASLLGTLTVGTATAPNKVTFGNYSHLRVAIGKNRQADKLDVYGTVDLSSATDNLTLTVDPDAKSGVYTLVSASGGITGTFSILAENFPDPSLLSYTATSVDYTVRDRATRIKVY